MGKPAAIAKSQSQSQSQRQARRGVGRPGEGEDVRGAILSAALRQLEVAGSPDRVTVSAIIAEAGCTPPSLYHYWPTRELLLREASALGWAQFRASQARALAGRDELDRDPGHPHGEGLAQGSGQGSGQDPIDQDPIDQDPIERLRRRGRAYLDFALTKPSLFRVLFLEPVPVAGAVAPGAPNGPGARSASARVTAPGVPGDTPFAPPRAIGPIIPAGAPGPAAPAGPFTGPAEPSAPAAGPAASAGAGQALQELVADVSAAMATGQLRTADPFITALAVWSSMHGVAALWAVTPSLPTELAHAVGDLAQEGFLTGLATCSTGPDRPDQTS